MPSVRIEIVRYTDDHQPGFVECRLTDLYGHVWTFEEKVPVVCAEYLTADSPYPQVGYIGCTIAHQKGETVRVSVDALTDEFECDVPASTIAE